ncbi:cytochrome P450 [Amycolatopsis thermophila]|uniref:Cytochrome P450 n=1 Tax=Amycolatopsis thermophila TaxID=206084 RepID=A0ABU0F576_9PSEU|nr:cytochrome P450 [Amycolatopsis thermophila]MDQ0382744.1 cytochrome P450 [Amycolatopsis thermophila]
MAQDVPLPRLDVMSEEFNDDPHGYLRQIRSANPVARNIYGMPVLLAHADVQSILNSPKVCNDYAQSFAKLGVTDGPFAEFHLGTILHKDGPDHTRLRKLVMHAFTPRAVARMKEPVRELCIKLVDEIGDSGEVDFIHDFAHQLPVQVICDVLGIPRADHHTFDTWVTDLNAMFSEELGAEGRRTAEAAVVNLYSYLEGLIAERRRDLGDDMLSTLIAAEEDGDRLSHDDLLRMVVLLMHGGHDTTRSALMIMMATLAENQELQDRLRADRALMRPAIEEILRLEPILPWLMRKARTDLDLGGGAVAHEGEMVQISLLAANRDPDVFTCPDELRLDREGPSHVTFGRGAHFCPGNALARLELSEALDVLLDRWKRWEFRDGERPKWIPLSSIRAFESLHLSFEVA